MRTVISFRITAISTPEEENLKRLTRQFDELFEKVIAQNLLKVVAGLPKYYKSESNDFAQITWTCDCPYEELGIFIETWNEIEGTNDIRFSPFILRVGELLL